MLAKANKREPIIDRTLEFYCSEKNEQQNMFSVRVFSLTKRFGTEVAVDHVNVDFEAGKIHGIVGRNGSGKTVLLKCVCGFLRPDLGGVRVFGKVIGDDCDFPSRTGILIERPGYLPSETGRNNLIWLAKMDNTDLSRVDLVLQMVGLDAGNKKPVSRYSLGMQQKLGIAQAILSNPDLLILDEPMNALDQASVQRIRHMLLNLKSEGKTIILASHFAQDIDELCDTVYEMKAGAISKIK